MSEPFDFDAFIAGTQLPRRTIEAYRVDNSDEIRRLQAEHDAMPPESDDREVSGNAPTTSRRASWRCVRPWRRRGLSS